MAMKPWPIRSAWDMSHALWMGHLDLAVRLHLYLWILLVNLTTHTVDPGLFHLLQASAFMATFGPLIDTDVRWVEDKTA